MGGAPEAAGERRGQHVAEDSEDKTTRIGGYEILARLGQGGMGAVYKARQVSMDRIVALKVLPPRLAKDEAYVQRFLREARSAAALQHPNIVQGIDVGYLGPVTRRTESPF